MDRAQAGEIFGHLFDAARELDEARAVASALAPQDESAASLDVVQAKKLCEQRGLEISYEGLAARLQVLADSGRIEDAGDLRKWRFSEVRLKG